MCVRIRDNRGWVGFTSCLSPFHWFTLLCHPTSPHWVSFSRDRFASWCDGSQICLFCSLSLPRERCGKKKRQNGAEWNGTERNGSASWRRQHSLQTRSVTALWLQLAICTRVAQGFRCVRSAYMLHVLSLFLYLHPHTRATFSQHRQ